MRWLKVILCISLIAPAVCKPSQPKKLSQVEAQQKLIQLAAVLQNYELQLSTVENDLNQAREEENLILQELDHYNQRLMETVHYLRHATHFSPLLAMLSARKPEDVIHSSMLLRSITPEMQYRNQQLFEKVKSLSQIRQQLESKQDELRTITFNYHQERDALDTVANSHAPADQKIGDNLANLQENISLKKPVVGKIIPSYQSTKPELASFTQGILIESRPEAQVVAPTSGLIIFAGDYANGQGKMISIQTSNSLVMMTGMEILNRNCTAGRKIVKGEPIGRMPKKQTIKPMAQHYQPRLYLEVWQHEQTVDPQSILES